MPAPTADLFEARLARLRTALAAAEVDGLLLSSLPNITYISGLNASAALAVVTGEQCWLISDGRYATALRDRAVALPSVTPREVPPTSSYEQTIAHVVAEAGISRLGFESAHLSVRRFRWLERASAPNLTWIETHELVERLRAVKDPWELSTLREAGARLSDAAKCILSKALAGLTEREFARSIEQEMAKAGFSRPAFDTIVASGSNAALPHHRAGTRMLGRGDIVVLDFGGIWDGYAVDVSRTRVVGPATAEQTAWIEAVCAAQDAAIGAIGHGVAPEDVDAAARTSLEAGGLGEYFTHSTGHGLGLEVHELPRVGRRRPGVSEARLEAGMVLTVEPGVYLPGKGGVRIEDDVLVTPGGSELLTDVPRIV